MRTFAIVSACILALLLLLAGAGWYWWQRNGESIVTSSRTAFDEGRHRGSAVDEAACVAEVLERHRSDRDGKFGEVVARGIWLSSCLQTSRVAASFCDGVPPADQVVSVSTWSSGACTRQGLSDTACPSLYQQVARYCSSPQRAAKRASTATP